MPASGFASHQRTSARQAVAAHHAVGVEHDHVAVVAAPAPAEVGDVAALALDAVLAPAVEDATEAVHRPAQLEPRRELRRRARPGRCCRTARRSRSARARPVRVERFVGRAQPREHARARPRCRSASRSPCAPGAIGRVAPPTCARWRSDRGPDSRRAPGKPSETADPEPDEHPQARAASRTAHQDRRPRGAGVAVVRQDGRP